MNIYLHELKANRKFNFIWLLSMLILAGIMISMYISFNQDLDAFKQILTNYPENLRKAFGISIDKLGSVLGYYSSFVLTIVVVCGSVQAMIFGMSILSKEIREKTADFLYSKPISRNKIITSKLLASFTLLAFCNIIFISGIYLLLLCVSSSSFDLNTFILLGLIPFIMQLIFFSLGILISAVMSKVKAILPISMGVVFGFYILSSFADEKFRVILPFKYFDATYILNNSKYEFKYVILTFAVISISTALTYVIYNKKDIHSV